MDAAWSNFLFQVGFVVDSFVFLLYFTFYSHSVCPAAVSPLPHISYFTHKIMLWLVFTFGDGLFLLASLQNTPTQNQVEGSLQSELMPVHTSSPQTPPTEHIAQPPSTVDTAALSEEPLPGEGHCTASYTCGADKSKYTTHTQQLSHLHN